MTTAEWRDEAAVRAALTGGLASARILVVGDLMLDHTIFGTATRLSPEAPVPVVLAGDARNTPGGAGLAAACLRALGVGLVTVVGAVGPDQYGADLIETLAGMGVKLMVVEGAAPTTVKVRVMAGARQLLRIDHEQPMVIEDAHTIHRRVLRQIAARTWDVVLVSDYTKGFLSEHSCRRLIATARHAGVPVVVGAKHDLARYVGATVVLLNDREARALLGGDDAEISASWPIAVLQYDLSTLVVTRGAQGLVLFRQDVPPLEIPTSPVALADPTGAGDQVAAVVAAGCAAKLAMEDACRLAVLAATAGVTEPGTSPVAAVELLELLPSPLRTTDIVCPSLPQARERVEAWRGAGARIVLTNGCFDVLHAGHVHLLQTAAACGDRLIVAVNSDASIARLKGPGRPVQPLADRMAVLAALRMVDLVVPFYEDTPMEMVEVFRPDVLVKGAEYSTEQVVGADEVRGWGGEVVLVPMLPGWSTSGLLARIRA